MQTVREEITAEEYKEIAKLPYKEQERKLFPNGIPVAWECGYGYYGHRLAQDGKGKYYAEFSLGSTMD